MSLYVLCFVNVIVILSSLYSFITSIGLIVIIISLKDQVLHLSQMHDM